MGMFSDQFIAEYEGHTIEFEQKMGSRLRLTLDDKREGLNIGLQKRMNRMTF